MPEEGGIDRQEPALRFGNLAVQEPDMVSDRGRKTRPSRRAARQHVRVLVACKVLHLNHAVTHVLLCQMRLHLEYFSGLSVMTQPMFACSSTMSDGQRAL